ncbi:hypothetical protein ANO11243_091400 [Dothideomycetidae sp. 11243]|nr:hypothetical protein ANO11243_091400 [fungal sp. No.11243]
MAAMALFTVFATIVHQFAALKLYQVIYKAFLHPLCKIPGPWWANVSRVPYAYQNVSGKIPTFLRSLHQRYGPIVRYSPNEISVIDGNAWQEIYGFRNNKQRAGQSFDKDLVWYVNGIDDVPHLINAPADVHGRQRRVFSHAFTDKALYSQEWLLQKYSNLLVSRITEVHVQEDSLCDLSNWYAWVTFDTIADLTFGSSFNCLESASTKDLVALLQNASKQLPKIYCMRYWPVLQRIHQMVFGVSKTAKIRDALHSYVRNKVAERMNMETGRQDLMTTILNKQAEDSESISTAEITSNALLFLAAGPETSATLLTIATWFMLYHPHIYAKVREEVRGRFKTKEEITIQAVASLSYTIAVLTETMRMMPPTTSGFLRKVPSNGAVVSGHILPGDCNLSISISQQATYRDPANFLNPDTFDPQRWLDDPKYEKDNRSSFQPFSFGPRNCVGKNLAYAETRLILTKMVFAFDMELGTGMDAWIDRCVYIGSVWIKPPLMVKLSPAA